MGFADNARIVLQNNRRLQKNLRKSLLAKKGKPNSNKFVPITNESTLKTLELENKKYLKKKLASKGLTVVKQRIYILMAVLFILLISFLMMN